MQADERPPTPSTPAIWTTTSLACDLSWTLTTLVRRSVPSKHPVVDTLFAGSEDLVERVRTFWGDESPEICFTETLILAHHGGAWSESSPTALWSALASAVDTVPTDLALESETAEDRAVFMNRLRRLKASPELVRSYVALLSEVWDVVDDLWQASRARLEESGRQMLRQIELAGRIEPAFAAGCDIFMARLPSINARIAASQSLVVVPCLFFGNALYLEFPGLIVVGTGVEQNDLGARARTESLARSLKTVADPTRLALLHFLAHSPSTVGHLATSFGLAQPTVSLHVKSLRAAGLVKSERSGGRQQLSVEPDAMNALVEELRCVTQGASTTGNERMPATVVEATRSAVPVTA
jgi:DNA-binding transcriptional ArsR family regulator